MWQVAELRRPGATGETRRIGEAGKRVPVVRNVWAGVRSQESEQTTQPVSFLTPDS